MRQKAAFPFRKIHEYPEHGTAVFKNKLVMLINFHSHGDKRGS